MKSTENNQKEILSWLNYNRNHLKPYSKQYIAISKKGILASSMNLDAVLEKAGQTNEYFAIYYVPSRSSSLMTILPIRIRSVSRHEWRPEYVMNGDLNILFHYLTKI